MSTKRFFFRFFQSWGAPEQRTQSFKLLMSIIKWVASCIQNQNKYLFWSQTCAIRVFTSKILVTCFFNCSFATFVSDHIAISCLLAAKLFDRSTLYWLLILAVFARRNLAFLFFPLSSQFFSKLLIFSIIRQVFLKVAATLQQDFTLQPTKFPLRYDSFR